MTRAPVGQYTPEQARQREFETRWRAGYYAQHRYTGKLYAIEDSDELGIMVKPVFGDSWSSWIGWAELRLKYVFMENDE